MKELRLWRKKKGLTQIQLGAISNIDSNLISRYESGNVAPTMSSLEKLASGLEISIEELLRGPDNSLREFKLIFDKDGECNLDVMNISANAPEEKVMVVSADRIAIKTNIKTTGMTREEVYRACMKDFNETFNDAWDQQEKWRCRKARN